MIHSVGPSQPLLGAVAPVKGCSIPRKVPSLFHIAGRRILGMEDEGFVHPNPQLPAYVQVLEELDEVDERFAAVAQSHGVMQAVAEGQLTEYASMRTGTEKDWEIHQVLQELRSLRYLVIQKTDGLTLTVIKEIFQTSRLRALTLVGNTAVTDEVLTALPKGYEGRLESLHLNPCNQLTVLGGEALRMHFPHLKRVTLVNPDPGFEAEVRKNKEIKVKVESEELPQ